MPLDVLTDMAPVVAPAGAVAVSCIEELTVKAVAATPLNQTELAPVRLEPLIITFVPTGPVVGDIPLMVGGATLCVTAADLLGAKVVLPLYTATTACDPAARAAVLSLAVPVLRITVASVAPVVVSSNVTVPVGDPPEPVTVAVKTTC